MIRRRCTILAIVVALNASLAFGGEKDNSQAVADVYYAAAQYVGYALGTPKPETSPASIAIGGLLACAKRTHYDPSLVDPIIGELGAIPPGTDQRSVLERMLEKFKAKAKATGKKPVNVCNDAEG